MASANDLAKMVPGFDFLQGLMKNAGAGLPQFGQWVAPTLNPEELGKRIDELRTVQFWLEQNAKLLGTTIQALEVQRMTLATLQSMNLPMADLSESLKIVPRFDKAGPQSTGKPENKPSNTPSNTPAPEAEAGPKAGKAKPAPAVDPMQWWGALTQQFTELATQAMRDSSAEAARNLAGNAMKQGVQAAAAGLKQAAAAPAKVAGLAAKAVAGAAAKAAAKGSAKKRAS